MNNKIDIVDLLEKNPLTRLNENYQSRFIDKIKYAFTETQQHMFVGSFYCYLNYNSKKDFVIDLENVWKWLGFSRKEHAKVVLEKHFTKEIDYQVKKAAPEVAVAGINLGGAGKNKELILMNVNTFKKLCLKSNTKKSDEIHNYFIKLEEIFQEILSEESVDLKKKLMISQEINTKLEEEKSLEKHNILLREFATSGSLIYILRVKSYKNGTYIIKIGESRRGIKDRYNEHKTKYEEAVLLDCFSVQKSKEFELFLHNNFKNSKVKNLLGHESEQELFLIGEELNYNTLLNIINQNIKYYNDYNNFEYELQLSKLEFEKLKLMSALRNNEFIKTIIDGNKLLLNKIDNLEKTQNVILNELNSITQKTVNNFNEPLVNLGPRLQKINPETFLLVKVYQTVTECIKEDSNMKRSSINKAALENTIYNGFRWVLVDRELDPNIIKELPNTKITRPQNVGYIAKLNKEQSKILNVYLDRKTASKLNNYPSDSSLDLVVKNKRLSNDNYYILYEDCSTELKSEFKVEPILYKNGVGKFNIENKLINEFVSKSDCVQREPDISEKTLKKSLETGKAYKNHYYKFLYNKLFI